MRLPCCLIACLLLAPLTVVAADGAAPRTLLFVRGGDVWSCDAGGGQAQQLTRSAQYTRACWTCRGKAIAAYVPGDGDTVRKVNFLTAEGVYLGAIAGEVLQLQDTPRGSTVALVARPGGKWAAIEAPSGRILCGPQAGSAPSLSPDGHTIAFHLYSRVTSQSLPSAVVYLADLAAPAEPRRLSPPLGRRVYEGTASYVRYFDQSTEVLAWSHGGDRLIVFRYCFENGDWIASVPYVTSLDRWDPTPLALMGCCSLDYAWRPRADSAQIAATAWGRHGPTWAVLLEGDALRTLPDLKPAAGWMEGLRNTRSLGWSPAGRYLLTASEDEGWIAVTDADARQELPRRLEGASEARIDTAEQTLAYVREGRLYVVPLAALSNGGGGEAAPVGPGTSPDWRP